MLLYEYLRGSRAYGLDKEDGTSDYDYGGIFMEPLDEILGMRRGFPEMVSSIKSDIVWYGLTKFFNLLLSSNPTILESLFIPEHCIVYEHPLMTEIKKHKEKFITKACFNAFNGYAVQQIQKARGLNKKISNPIVERKDILDFIYVYQDGGSVPIKKWLEENHLKQENCGLVNIPNMHNCYALYYDSSSLGYRGIVSKEGENESNEVRLSSVPKGEEAKAIIFYNASGYTKHCIDYKAYKEWEKNRNPERYKENVTNNRGYDCKNMAHCVRLLHMGNEIATTGQINVDRRNIDRGFIMEIRNGKMSYDEIISYVDSQKKLFDENVKKCTLPEQIDSDFAQRLILDIRKKFFNLSF